jgi:hypothetical protein
MATEEQWANARLDGRNADTSGILPWRPTVLYREYSPGDPKGIRTGGPTPGQPWSTPSALDELTVLAEILTVTHNGKTLADMIIELHTKLVGDG